MILIYVRVLVPIVNWQNQQLDIIQGKLQQLNKLNLVVVNKSKYEENYAIAHELLDKSSKSFYFDNTTTKLDVQRQIEALFDSNKVSIVMFSWVFDETQLVRTLRASVKYKGREPDVIKTFWDLSHRTQIVRHVQWTFKKDRRNPSLEQASGVMTIEFYAVTPIKYLDTKLELVPYVSSNDEFIESDKNNHAWRAGR